MKKQKCIHGKKATEWHCSRCKEGYDQLRFNDGYIEALTELEDWLENRKIGFRLRLTEDEKKLWRKEMNERFKKHKKRK